MQVNRNRFFTAMVLTVTLTLLAACDQVNGPTILKNQRELSDIVEGRHYQISAYYQGRIVENGEHYHVFAERIISKFHSGIVINLYYLPLKKINISTNPGLFKKRGSEINRKYLFYYVHDDGAFYIARRHKKFRIETITASFKEKYSKAEENCLRASAKADENPRDFGPVYGAALLCRHIALEKSSRYMKTLGPLAEARGGEAKYRYHTLLGRWALQAGNQEEAKRQLLLSVNVTPSPVMKTFGPDMSLALELFRAGEKATVEQFLNEVSKFWGEDRVSDWKRKHMAKRRKARDYCYIYLERKEAAKAFEHCSRQAAEGKASSQYNLANMYRTGNGVARNMEKAFEFYQLAAQRGYPEAQFSLGILYFEGAGTRKNVEKARHWWEKARHNGVARAKEALERIP